MKAKEYPSQERIKELFYYENGNLFWRKDSCNRKFKKNGIVGTLNHDGYVMVGINYKKYQLHRLVFIYFNGDIENNELDVDHINRTKSDNRIENLRLITHQQNSFNSFEAKGYGKTNNSKNPWVSWIKKGHIRMHLGYFKTEQEAKKAYLKAKKKYHIIEDR